MPEYTEKDFEDFRNNPKQLKHWISLCKEYIATRPSHSCGFCYWATVTHEIPFAYLAGSGYTRMYTQSDAKWVDNNWGVTLERIAFVEWMLNQCEKDLKQLSNKSLA